MSQAGAYLASVALFAIAFGLYALVPALPPFSDGIFLSERVATGWAPYYNALYLPLGWAFQRLGEPLFGWNCDEGLLWFARACCAASAPLAWRVLRRLELKPLDAFFGSLLLALTPSVLFFANVVEVHSLQLLGVLIATELALVARNRRSAIAICLVLAGAFLSVLTHLTSVLFIPVLVWLARGSDGSGIPLARLVTKRTVVPTLLGLAALVGAAWAIGSRAEANGWLAPFRWLVVFGESLADRIAIGDLFGPAESVRYLWYEFVLPAGMLTGLFVIGLGARASRREAVALSVLSVPFIAIFSQGGVWEGGAYFLALWPLVIAAGLRGLESLVPDVRLRAALLTCLLVAQGVTARCYLVPKRAAVDARAFVVEVETLCPPGSLIVTDSLPSWHALGFSDFEFVSFDLGRDLQLAPKSRWDAICRERIGLIGRHARTGRTFLGADLIDGSHPLGYYEAFRNALAPLPVALIPIPESAPLLYEIKRL